MDLFLVGAHGPERTVAYALAAERAGFEGVWFAEHHFISYGQTPSATTLAAHVLGRTERIGVGTAACVLSARHPVALGEEAAMLNSLAPGRFRLGVARGGPWVELEVFGTGLARYERGFPEALDILRRWLSGGATVGADGEFFRFREVAVVPRPTRPVPIWVAATSTATVDVAAARALPVLLGVHDDQAAKAAMLARYARAARAHGHDPAVIPHACAHLAYLGDPGELRPRLRSWLATTREYVKLDGSTTGRDLEAYTDHLLGAHPIGPECVGRLLASAAAVGARRLLLMVEAAGPETENQIVALGEALSRAVRPVAPIGGRGG